MADNEQITYEKATVADILGSLAAASELTAYTETKLRKELLRTAEILREAQAHELEVEREEAQHD